MNGNVIWHGRTVEKRLEDDFVIAKPGRVEEFNRLFMLDPSETVVMAGRRMGKSTITNEQIGAIAKAIQENTGLPASMISNGQPASLTLEDVKKSMAVIQGATSAPAAKPNMFDGIKAAATQFTRFEEERNTMDDAKHQAALQLAQHINDFLKGSTAPVQKFKLTGAAQLTIKTRQSQYKKKAFLGDEEMTLQSAYAGSRDGCILVFKNALPVDYAYIEIPLSEAPDRLVGFRQYMQTFGIADIDTIVAGIETEKTQAAAAEHDAMLADPEFASW